MKVFACLTGMVMLLSCGGSTPGPETDLIGYAREGVGHGGELIGYLAADDTWLAKGTAINEVKNGTWITYHPGENMPKVLTTYLHGQKNGVEIEFNERGQMIRFTEYKNDELHGLSAKYQFGRTTEETHYKDGVMHGPFAIYTTRGELQRRGEFKDGKQHGTLQYFDEQGNITLEYQYQNGEKISGGIVDRENESTDQQ